MALFRQRRGGHPLAAGLVVLLVASLLLPLAAASPSREQAEEFYRYAKLLRQDLETVPAVELGEDQYLLVIDAFQKVHRASPASSYCDDALFQAAELYREMVVRWGAKAYGAKATAAYEFLIREYPHSKLLDQARQAVGEIAKGIPPGKAKPAAEPAEVPARPVRAEAALPQPVAAPPAAASSNDAVAVLSSRSMVLLPVSETPRAANPRQSVAHLQGVRHWSSPGYTRVVIEVEDRVEISYDQLRDPKRLFFNLMETRLGKDLEQEASFDVGDEFLTRIRVAQYDKRSTRVVFDLARNLFFEVSWLSNPARLVVEVRGNDEPVMLTDASPSGATYVSPDEAGAAPADASRELLGRAAPLSTKDDSATASFAKALDSAGSPPSAESSSQPPPAASQSASSSQPVTSAKPAGDTKKVADTAGQPPAGNVPAVKTTKDPAAAKPQPVKLARAEPPPVVAPPPAVTLPVPKPATANAKGQRNLIRALGLKVGRVVIDAGHGGRDTGSIGPSGLREKDLVLDVALRLGKLISEGLGSEIIHSRDDDRFISLKERTKIANDAQADLFISIHANSSSSEKVRGVETYYLNFTTDSWALTVASRENAASDRSVHELQDLLSKIALKEKIEESLEFATRVQNSLYEGLSEDNKGLRNRGVRKAPFMVLIGAKMPAVLAEVGFISNPQTEKLLKTPEFRQKIANHLYQGVLAYSESLGTVSMAEVGAAKAAGSTPGLD